jgi:hypothetical protein
VILPLTDADLSRALKAVSYACLLTWGENASSTGGTTHSFTDVHAFAATSPGTEAPLWEADEIAREIELLAISPKSALNPRTDLANGHVDELTGTEIFEATLQSGQVKEKGNGSSG